MIWLQIGLLFVTFSAAILHIVADVAFYPKHHRLCGFVPPSFLSGMNFDEGAVCLTSFRTGPATARANGEGLLMDDLLAYLLKHDPPDLRSLALALKSYQELKREKVRNLADVAEALDVPKDTLYRAIREFEDKLDLGKKVFHKTSGRGTTRVADDAEQLFRNVDEMLRCFARVLRPGVAGPTRLRVGAALTLCMHLVPSVLRAFREAEPDARLEIELSHGFPQDLVTRGQKGELDLVLTTCQRDLGDAEEEVVKQVTLQMYLVCPRDHRLVRLPEFDWRHLAGLTVVLLTENRVPMPRYPLDKLPDDVRIVRVESYPQAHSLVLGGGDIICFSFPQLFGPEERRFLDAIKVPELESVRLCLLRPRRARALHTREENVLLTRLAKEFTHHLHRIEDEFSRDDLRKASGPRRIYHVSRVGAGDAVRYQWLGGDLDLRFTEDGFVKGEHRIKAPSGEGSAETREVVYSLFGHVARSQSGRCHVVWRGSRPDSGNSGEDSLVSIVCDEARLNRGPLVGVWIGRQTWAADDFEFVPSGGYVVVVNTLKDLSASQLVQYVKDYENTFGKLQWPSLDQIQTG